MLLLEIYRKILSLKRLDKVDILYEDDNTLNIKFYTLPMRYRYFTIKEETDGFFSFRITDDFKDKTLKVSYETLYEFLFVNFFK